ncbi:hypothetical protein GCM10027189_15670 [Rufibacter soli]
MVWGGFQKNGSKTPSGLSGRFGREQAKWKRYKASFKAKNQKCVSGLFLEKQARNAFPFGRAAFAR